MEKANICESEVDVILYTGGSKDNISVLGRESKNCIVLDSACSSTVCGKHWLDCYLDSLDDDIKQEVKISPGKKTFKFGGGERLQSMALYHIPAVIAGRKIIIDTDVVESDIPLLFSLKDMKQLKIKLDLEKDTAEVFGKTIYLSCTYSGHYCIPIDDIEVLMAHVLVVHLDELDEKELHKHLLKLHRQFAHPTEDKLMVLLKNAGKWEDQYSEVLKKISDQCTLCKQFAKTPPRPVVGLPMATTFNEKVAMDLKKWGGKWILHMIDMWSRFTVSVFVNRKKPSEVIEKIMMHWVGAGFGVMEGILTDNGGEFNADEIREVSSILNVMVNTTAAESPFQNGLCERIHSVTDMMLLKLQAEQPNTPLDVLLCWACNARNSLQMWHGYSSYQLVFGKNPNLPNIMTANPPALEGTTSSAVLAKHLNALHGAREAFIKSEANERLRRAFRHKVRASEQIFKNGDRVFYKRKAEERWLGPGKVVFQDGRVVFVRHGGTFVRVCPNHLIKENNSVGDSIDEEKEIGVPSLSTPDEGEDEDGEVIGDEQADDGEVSEGTNRSAVTDENNSLPGNLQYPKKGQKIQYKEENEWQTAVVKGRGGKATGKYKGWYNVEKEDGEQRCVDLGKEESWKNAEEEEVFEEVNMIIIPREEHDGEECMKAKRQELDKLKQFNTYNVVDDVGQFRISSTWVLCKKGSEVRARLLARGFEEELVIQKDSPTIGKSTLRLFLSIVASESWKIKSTDIKSAFLQGKVLERDVFLKPPREAAVGSGKLWKLRHCLYGLNDAARQFYVSVEESLIGVGCKKSKLDPALFYYCKDGRLCGLLTCHVDDFAHAGDELFDKNIIKSLYSRFLVGKVEQGVFKYIGFNLTQNKDNSILLDQSEYVKDLENITVSSERKKMSTHDLTRDEYTCLRSIVGRINWAVQGSRPDLSFDLVDLSTKLKKGKVSDLIKATKCIKKLKYEDSQIMFPALDKKEKWHIIVFSDASHANLDGSGSVGAHVVFLVDSHGNCCTLTWQSNKIKRVVRSTIAAETLSLVEGIEDAIYLKHLLSEILKYQSDICIDAFVDNRNVVAAIFSTKSVDDKRLRIDISTLKEFVSSREVNSVKWCAGAMQLANCMTKKGANAEQLMNILKTGRLDLSGWS